VLDRLPIRTPVAAVKQAILGPSRYRLNRTTCFACFIRLRSGIANSPKRTARSSGRYARKYHAIMASAWLGSPQLELIGVLGRDPVGPAASARAVGRRPETPERRSFFRHPRESGGPGGRPRPLWPWIPAVAGMPGNADHRRLDTLAGAEQVDRPPCSLPGASLAGSRGRARRRPVSTRRRHRSPGSTATVGTGRRSSASSARPRR